MIHRRNIAILLAFTLLPVGALAQAPETQEPGIVAVTGEGIARLAPDMAVVTLTVLRQEKTADAALDANNTAMTDVLAAMETEGIAPRDLQTSNFAIDPQFVYPRQNDNTPVEPQIVGYRVSNTLTIRVRDLTKLGVILDRAVDLGVNQGGQIRFTNDDPSAALTEARKKAVSDAIDKAQTLTQAAGVSLGRITAIDERQRRAQPMPMMRAERAVAAAPGGSVPVASGENQYTVTVDVTFELQQ